MDGDSVATSTDLDVLVNARRFHHISAAGAFRLDDLHDCMRRQRFLADTMSTHVVPPPSSAHKAPLVEVPVLLHGPLAKIAVKSDGVVGIDRYGFVLLHAGLHFSGFNTCNPARVAGTHRGSVRFVRTSAAFTLFHHDRRMREQPRYILRRHRYLHLTRLRQFENGLHHDDELRFNDCTYTPLIHEFLS